MSVCGCENVCIGVSEVCVAQACASVCVDFLHLWRVAQTLPDPRATAGELDAGQLAEGKRPWAPSSCSELSSLCPLSAGHGWPSPPAETPVGKGTLWPRLLPAGFAVQSCLSPRLWVLPSLIRLPLSAHGHRVKATPRGMPGTPHSVFSECYKAPKFL